MIGRIAMATDFKKTKNYYLKSSPIIVDNYLMAHGHSVRHNLVAYLNKHRDKVFKKQEDIADAIKDELGFKRAYNKSSISKALKFIGNGLRFSDADGIFYFVKTNDGYRLQKAASENIDSLYKLYDMKSAFRKTRVHRLSDNTFAFAVNPQKSAKLKALFLDYLRDACYGVLELDDILLVMLDETSDGYKPAKLSLMTFFTRKAAYTKSPGNYIRIKKANK